jgi:hypothetical protein
MTRRVWITTAVAVPLAIGPIAFAQSFALRTGAWSLTMTAQSDAPMEGVPPEVRAQIEAQMKRPNTFTTCVTPEDLKNFNLGKTNDSDDADCELVSSKVTATVADITRRCTGDDPGTETSHFEAPTPVTLKGTVVKKTSKGTTTVNLTGKWASARCVE